MHDFSTIDFQGMMENKVMKTKVEKLLENVTKWAKSNSEILGIALVGSYARNEARNDSDVDLVILTTTPNEFIKNFEWIKDFGSVKSYQIEDWGPITSIRVYYQRNLEVEYGITSKEWASEPIDDGTRQVIADGMKVIIDKTGALVEALKKVTNTSSS